MKVMKNQLDAVVPDEMVMDMNEAVTGATGPATPVLNTDPASLCEVHNPLRTPMRMRRFLLRRARLLKSDENNKGQRRLLDDSEKRQLLEKRFLSSHDHCDMQVLSGAEIEHTMQQPFIDMAPEQIDTMYAKAEKNNADMAAHQHRILRKLMKDLDIHPEDAEELRRLQMGAQTGDDMFAEEPYTPMMTGCQVVEALSPQMASQIMTEYPAAADHHAMKEKKT